MTPRELSEQSLDALTAQIEAWRAKHPGESVQLSRKQQAEVWEGIRRRIQVALDEEVK